MTKATAISRMGLLAACVFIGSGFTPGNQVIVGTCSPPLKCTAIAQQQIAPCTLLTPADVCDFSVGNPKSTYVTCQNTGNCTIIQPYVPQPCLGACANNPSIACNLSFNKCK
jgi:hypothetical protein